MRRHLLLLSLLMLPSLATAADPRDPWEGFNRKVFAFNDWADRWFMTPVAKGYQAVTPEAVDRHVTHFFNNLRDVVDTFNHALQGEGRHAAEGTVRVLANTTLGVAGIFDVASAGGLPRRDNGFGTTLGKWGVGSGPYLVLPFLGMSTVRDAAAIPVNMWAHPLEPPGTLVPRDGPRLALEALDLIDMRADLLRYEQAVVGDRYGFLRDIYLQRRAFEVRGQRNPAEDPFLDDDFGDEDAGDADDAAGDDATSTGDEHSPPVEMDAGTP